MWLSSVCAYRKYKWINAGLSTQQKAMDTIHKHKPVSTGRTKQRNASLGRSEKIFLYIFRALCRTKEWERALERSIFKTPSHPSHENAPLHHRTRDSSDFSKDNYVFLYLEMLLMRCDLRSWCPEKNQAENENIQWWNYCFPFFFLRV